MYMTLYGKEIVIAPETQEDAKALLAVLSGTPIDDKSRELGQSTYAFFFEAVRQLATTPTFEEDVKWHRPFPYPPKHVIKESLKK